jgi:hypothetical protein
MMVMVRVLVIVMLMTMHTDDLTEALEHSQMS